MKFSFLTTLATTVAVATALNPDGTQHRMGIQSEWIAAPTARPAAPVTLTLVFAVKENLPGLSEAVNDLSDPASPNYGNWMTLDEVNARWSDEKARSAVRTFLLKNKLQPVAVGGGAFFKVVVPADKAGALLNANFMAYQKDGETVYRAQTIKLPESVAWAIDSVEYATQMPAAQKPAIYMSKDQSGAAGEASPEVIAKYYGIADNKVKNAKCTNSVFETIGQSINPPDVTAFDRQYNIPAQTFTIKGPNQPSSCAFNPNNCVESVLDTQIITSQAQAPDGAAITTWWSVPGSESFLQWILAVSADPTPPWVHSISYGEPEKYTQRTQDDSFDQALQKIALRGVSVLVSSGDDGVAGSQARGNPGACGFNPSYPATARYVTAVGATMGPEQDSAETACTSALGGGITTGGGFSTIFSQDSWQSAQVKNYIANGPKMPPANMYNSTKRGYPDVALMGHNYPVVIAGTTYHGSGTSASSPLFAAMITLANDARLSAGKKTLGWLNPVLYGLDQSVWTNITVGENNCAAETDPPTCCPYGFSEMEGWTPVTGLGSPRFANLLKALTAL
jgi:tripeptidyl-peptidase-1